MLKGFREIELFDLAQPIEYEANIFAAALLVFKFRVLKHKGYRIEAPYFAHGDFLKNDMD